MTAALLTPPARGLAQPVTLALLAMVSIQLAAALSRPLVAEIGAPAVTWLRMLAAAGVLMLLTRPRLRGLAPRAYGAALLLGAALAIMAATNFAAISRLPLGVVATIAFLGPLAVSILGARGWQPVGLALLAGGGVVLSVAPLRNGGALSALDPTGLVLALIAAAGFAAYIVLTRRVGSLFPGTDGLTLSLITASILLTPFGLAGLDHAPGVSTILGSAALAVLSPLVTCWFEMTALRSLGTQCFSILISLEPAIATLLGLVLLQEMATAVQVMGLGCVILASVLAVRLSARSAA